MRRGGWGSACVCTSVRESVRERERRGFLFVCLFFYCSQSIYFFLIYVLVVSFLPLKYFPLPCSFFFFLFLLSHNFFLAIFFPLVYIFSFCGCFFELLNTIPATFLLSFFLFSFPTSSPALIVFFLSFPSVFHLFKLSCFFRLSFLTLYCFSTSSLSFLPHRILFHPLTLLSFSSASSHISSRLFTFPLILRNSFFPFLLQQSSIISSFLNLFPATTSNPVPSHPRSTLSLCYIQFISNYIPSNLCLI